MKSPKKKASAKTKMAFKDLGSKKNPKGGWSGGGGDGDAPMAKTKLT